MAGRRQPIGRFLLTSLLFACVLLVMLQLHELLVPYYWGDSQYVKKMSYLRNHKDEFNTYFIGSSGFYRHIVPLLFDSLTTVDTRSFNLGVPAGFPPSTYAFYESFLEQDARESTRYVFVELP